MVNIPKTCQTFCRKCGKHQPHKVTKYKKEEGQGFAVCPEKMALRQKAEWLWWADQTNFLEKS
jgi:ribosomal protein L44E